MLRCFEQESVGLSEAQYATRGTVPIVPSETEVEHQAARIDTPTIVEVRATNYIVMGEDGTPITVPAGYDELTKTLFPNAVCCKDTSSLYAETTLATNVWSWAFLCLAHGGTTSSDLVRP